jgi:hypothetical protein
MTVNLLAYANASSSVFGTPPGDTKHTVNKPAAATTGTYLVILLAMSSAGTSVLATATDASGTFVKLLDQNKTGTPSIEFYAFAKFIVDGDPASWDFTFSSAIANALSQTYVFTGVDPATPVNTAQWLAQAASNTSRITPTVTLPEKTYVFYGTHDRNASAPTFPDAGTVIQAAQASNVSIASLPIGLQAAGTYTKTMTAAAATSVAGSFIIALNRDHGSTLMMMGV